MHTLGAIPAENIRCHIPLSSKKRALEQLSELLDTHVQEEIDQGVIFNALLSRERLGTTGFGHGVAIPHGRIAGLQAPVMALMTLDIPIDFDAIDQRPVDLLVAMIVPDDGADAHIELLSKIATMLRTPSIREALRGANSSEEAVALLNEWDATAPI